MLWGQRCPTRCEAGGSASFMTFLHSSEATNWPFGTEHSRLCSTVGVSCRDVILIIRAYKLAECITTDAGI